MGSKHPEAGPASTNSPEPLSIWRIPKTRGTLLGVPILRIIVYWGLYWGPPILGNYHINSKKFGAVDQIIPTLSWLLHETL